jgi:signal transduction histidine kinase
LQNAGYTVLEAANGFEALQKTEAHKPHVVILDIQLPDISGIEVCEVIKKRWPEIMVLQTSATYTTGADRTRGLHSGADSYLTLPLESEELIAAVAGLLRIRRSEDALRALNATLEKRIAERTADLAEANAKLREQIAQREKVEGALIQAQKMEAIGHLTGGIAHDFNNFLTAVVGNLDLIRTRATDPRIARLADNALSAAQRGSRLTGQLLAFSRSQRLAAEPVDLNSLVTGMSDLLSQSLGKSITLKTSLAAKLPPVMGNHHQLELAILNLAINGRDAMPDGGTISIKTERSDRSGFARITVSDTGLGMSPEIMARAFDPFFTTKPTGRGTGLGLSQVYGVVRQLNGEVEIKSEIGKGTTVEIVLPLAPSRSIIEQESGKVAQGPAGTAKILVIDDDDDVRDVITSTLSDLGYQLRTASSGAEGVQNIREWRPDLVVLDFAMPGMNGAEVAFKSREGQPDLRILFVSGYSDTSALEAAVGNTPLLHKPFRPADLAVAVAKALEESAS